MLTTQDINNIILLITQSQIKGSDAVTVAVLLQKLEKMKEPEVKEEKKK